MTDPLTNSVGVQPEQVEGLVAILALVHCEGVSTRPELGKRLGLGRTVVTQRLEQAIQLGLLHEAELGQSTGGRAPRLVRFDPTIGCLLIAVFGSSHAGIGLCDLNGDVEVQEDAAVGQCWEQVVAPVDESGAREHRQERAEAEVGSEELGVGGAEQRRRGRHGPRTCTVVVPPIRANPKPGVTEASELKPVALSHAAAQIRASGPAGPLRISLCTPIRRSKADRAALFS
jgi:hypothetical protein